MTQAIASNNQRVPQTLHEYIRLAYRGTSAYSDRMPDVFLTDMHAATPLDRQLLNNIKRGKSIVLTGNPGDGKTHLLRVLHRQIIASAPKAVLELDASEKSNVEIIDGWKNAHTRKVPYCLAINEAVLKSLADEYPAFAPVVDAQSQVEHALVYMVGQGAPRSKDTTSSVAVFDLSRRNVLNREIVKCVIARMTDMTLAPPEPECLSEANDFARHVEILRSPVFVERLQLLFDRLWRRGYHATLRELQGFISFLLLRGRTCKELAAQSGNAETFITELVFSGQGRLFAELRSVFDPGTTCHPMRDEELIRANSSPDSWHPQWVGDSHSILPDQVPQIAQRRRRFYFCNTHGEEYLMLSPDVDSEFASFLEMDDRDAIRALIVKLNAAFRCGDLDTSLRVWKAHHFDHSVEKTLCSTNDVHRRDLELARPLLRPPMSTAFELAQDHVILRPRQPSSARLLVDYDMFALLRQAELGMPILALQNHLTRRIWSFMERLCRTSAESAQDEVDVVLLDLQTAQSVRVSIDVSQRRYLGVHVE